MALFVKRFVVIVMGSAFSVASFPQSCPEDPRCINNSSGAGNPNRKEGLMNPNSPSGSVNSDTSWTNPYARNAPRLYDRNGRYLGNLSVSKSDPSSISNSNGAYGGASSPLSRNGPDAVYVSPQSNAVPPLTPNNVQPINLSDNNYGLSKGETNVIGVLAIGFLIKKLVDESERNSNALAAKKADSINNLIYGKYLSDKETALRYLEQLSSSGDIEAKYAIAYALSNNILGRVDHKRAFELYKEAADWGSRDAQLATAIYYADEKYTWKSNVLAAKYGLMAADGGSNIAQAEVAQFFLSGFGVEKNVQSALRYSKRSCESGYQDGCNIYARALNQTLGASKKDWEEALKWIRLSAEQGNSASMLNLSIFLGNKNNTIYDPVTSVNWLKTASTTGLYGFAGAQNNLGDKYETGHGVKESFGNAIYWYTRSAMQGEPTAYWSLGTMFADGVGLKEDPEEAAFWLMLAAEKLLPGRNKLAAYEKLQVTLKKLQPSELEYLKLRAKQFKPLRQEEILLGDSD